jgi:hypothetical protein
MIVLAGFVFLFSFVAIAKIIGDSYFLTIIFFIGWISILGAFIWYFTTSERRD